MAKIIKTLFLIINYSSRGVYKYFVMPLKKYLFACCGENVIIGRGGKFTYCNVNLGNNVFIGEDARFMATRANIIIGNNVMLGPHVTIITGGHRMDILGRYMTEIKDKEKRPEDDRDIIIKDDVWIGANAIILRGVTINEGCVIAAGSVVTKTTPAYCVIGGVPAKVIKKRFNDNEIAQHISLLSEIKIK